MTIDTLISKVKSWPNKDQTLLLKAALSKDKSAIEAWEQWCSKVDFENTDNGSYRLYPLVYRNLTDMGVKSDTTLERCKGVYRYYWAYSHQLFQKSEVIIKELMDADIPVLILKGTPLALNYYNNLATRPLNDIDIMVSHTHKTKTIEILERNGFHAVFPILKETFSWEHAKGFKNKDGFEIDLHLSLIAENLNKEYQKTYWDQAELFEFQGLKVLTTCATDHLFHTIIHGVRHNDLSPIRWIVDAKMILDKGTIDWERFITLAKENKLSVALVTSLVYLKRHFITTIPKEVIDKLQQIPHSRIEEIEFISKNKALQGIIHRIQTQWFYYSRASTSNSYYFPFSFLTYLKTKWWLPSIAHIPLYIGKALWRITTSKD
ncbi:nucleotidyltransferase domain-containing protein [Aquimarina sp. 2201CG14-23]|uniref:nucleotidyltransferase domain-containing protein n=1 Tax=Aquimarina mycalae TaxID=3040073 RepID=UPI00247812C9|nr:nucleotidyltransferase family protein [Aquimarina sp. 2201CG14-23]MDH7445527.1 nucleotidyltransferase family protein [Aquimarina sp. 2201CG14-23]